MFQQERFFHKILYHFSSFSYRLDNFWQVNIKIIILKILNKELWLMYSSFQSIKWISSNWVYLITWKNGTDPTVGRRPEYHFDADRPRTTRHSKAHALVAGRNADNHCGPSNGIEFKWFPTPPPAFGNENGNLNVENWLLVVVGNIKAI